MTPVNLAGQFGDTTYTKVFVGGLAWETQKETMKKYFEQFGEILEAVVITDKATGRSKGYGFVCFISSILILSINIISYHIYSISHYFWLSKKNITCFYSILKFLIQIARSQV